MKKTFLFYSALLLSLVGTAQTTIQSQQSVAINSQVQKQGEAAKIKSSGSASAASSVQTEAATKAESKAKAELANQNEVIINKKEAAEAKGKSTVEKIGQSTNKEAELDASASSDANVKAGESQAHINGSGTLNNGTTVSLAKVKDNSTEGKQEVKSHIEKNTNATVNKGEELSTAVKTTVIASGKQTSSAAVNTGTKVTGAIKAKPAPVKVKTQVQTNAIIKIR